MRKLNVVLLFAFILILTGCTRIDNRTEDYVPDSYIQETDTVEEYYISATETEYGGEANDVYDSGTNEDFENYAFEQIDAVYQKALEYFNDIKECNLASASELASSQNLIAFLDAWSWIYSTESEQDRLDIWRYLNDMKGHLGVDWIVITDKDGVVILRTQSPDNYADVLTSPHFMAGLQGDSFSFFSILSFFPVVVSSIAPVWLDGDVIGMISVSTDISNDLFVDHMSGALDAEVIIFDRERVVASTITTNEGHSIHGMRTIPDISDIVIVRGDTLKIKMWIFDVMYYSVYFPLRHWDNTSIGMVFVGIPEMNN